MAGFLLKLFYSIFKSLLSVSESSFSDESDKIFISFSSICSDTKFLYRSIFTWNMITK